ncbi:MAG: dehydrogenase [Planctomycetaceae bacterium]|nr:dehydrogenase [Planctomycetaceae bacterium]
MTDVLKQRFKLALTHDFYDATGNPRYQDIGLDLLATQPSITVERFSRHEPEIAPDQLADADAVLVLTPRVTARSLSQADRLLVVARFGVGYDSVDVAACTARDVALTITVGAVDRPVAEATLAWMLALAYRVSIKDRLIREARWDDRSAHMGLGLSGRTLGIIGFGGIGRTLAALTTKLDMAAPLVFDPFLPPDAIAAAGGESTTLDDLLVRADFVSIHCPLLDTTRGLIGRDQLARMKPTAFLINTARGGIVDEAALYDALSKRQIAGAALDCFENEPLTTAPRFAELDNVLLAPHAIAWTDDLFRDIGRTALTSVVDVLHGKQPARGVVNPEVFSRPGFQAKLQRARRG